MLLTSKDFFSFLNVNQSHSFYTFFYYYYLKASVDIDDNVLQLI